MSQPKYPLVLGGVTVSMLSGSPALSYETQGGNSRVRLSKGRLVHMEHWDKMGIVISGSGWLGPGLDGLDFSVPHELLCTRARWLNTPELTCTLTSDVRPDVLAWCDAVFPDNTYHRTPVAVAGRQATITPVAGAVTYIVGWLPRYLVLASMPTEAGGGSDNEWQIVCEEV